MSFSSSAVISGEAMRGANSCSASAILMPISVGSTGLPWT